MKKKLLKKSLLIASLILLMATVVKAQDKITFSKNIGSLPAYNPGTPSVDNAIVGITSMKDRNVSVSYKNATYIPDANQDILLGAVAFGTGSIEFDLPSGVGTLKFTRDFAEGQLVSPVVYVNGNKKAMTSGNDITINEEGVVSVKFANESTNPAEGVVVLNVEWTDYVPTAINEVSAGINVYPNPVSNVLKFDDISNIKSICFYDIAGSCVKTIESVNQNQIDVMDLKAGIYVLKIITLTGETQTQKITKN